MLRVEGVVVEVMRGWDGYCPVFILVHILNCILNLFMYFSVMYISCDAAADCNFP